MGEGSVRYFSWLLDCFRFLADACVRKAFLRSVLRIQPIEATA